jgi:ribosomal protein L11 methylase PrmA
VFHWQGRIYRTISRSAAAGYEAVRDSGLLRRLVDSGRLLAVTERDPVSIPLPTSAAASLAYLVEHPRLRFVSHPYEWPFRSLRSAALLHLDLHLDALKAGMTLSDATAYNVQFDGPDPVFIDVLSLRPYEEGEFWLGHRQFCEQFLNPLLLQSLTGISYNDWYRGRPEGLTAADVVRAMPRWRTLGPRTMVHVTLQDRAQRRARRDAIDTTGRRLPKSAFTGMLRGLRSWIASLNAAELDKTAWSDYEGSNSYAVEQNAVKHDMVSRFIAASRPARAIDVGCNTGAFAATAIEAGAGFVIGLDGDHGALDQAVQRAQRKRLPFVPLYMDLTNPSPDQGWQQVERRGLGGRTPVEAVIALAIVHHLAIGRNIPLDSVIDWLFSLAPALLVEFVPKDDPMVRLMLANRQDIFPGYDVEAFRASLLRHGRIIEERRLANGNRTLFSCERTRP